MSPKPKPLFWFTFFIVISGLIGFALYRAGLFDQSPTARPTPESGAARGPASAPSALNLIFYNSSAKKEWIDDRLKQFHDSGAEVNGQSIKVSVFHGNSGEQLDDIKDGRIKPDLWSPGDESWLQLAAAYWRDVKQMKVFDDYTPLVNIPLVIAMWEPMAKVLGHPGPIGWKDIARIAANPQGWAALGHPEWGKFRWGHAHPDANSGFLTIVSEVYAALGKTDGITTDDLKNKAVVSFLKEFEGSVEHYGLSNTWIDDLMHRKGPAYLSAAVQYENTIIQSNAKHRNQPFKLVAIYPTEGNFWTRHPIAIFKEAWVTPEKAAACQKFISFLTGKESQQRAMEMGLRPFHLGGGLAAPFDEAHGVNPKVVADKDFKVPEESVLKRIRDLWEEVKIPATIIMALDRSGSMKGAALDQAKIGAIDFIKSMKPRDQLMIMVFHNEVTVISELCLIRQCGESAAERLQNIFADGGTALHDAIIAGYQHLKALKQKEPGRRYCLLALSDGKDTSSVINRHDFLDSLPKGETYDLPKIFAIAYGSDADKELLAEIAARTNGRLFSSSPEEIRKTYKELSANF